MNNPDQILAAITRQRRTLRDFKSEFDYRKRIEFEIESRRHQDAMDALVLEADTRGIPRSKIGQAYGTKDRGTILRILERAMGKTAQSTPNTPGLAIQAVFDTISNVLTLTLKDAVLAGMAAAQDEPLSGTKEFRWTGTGWTSAAERKGPLDFQMTAWLNAAEDVNGDPSPLQGNALQAALTDAGIYDMLKSVTRTQTTAFDLPA